MTSAETILRDWFGVGPAAGRIITTLYAAEGRMVSHSELARAGKQTRNGVALSIRDLRAAMESGSIICDPKLGYYLSDTGLRDCTNAFLDAERRGEWSWSKAA